MTAIRRLIQSCAAACLLAGGVQAMENPVSLTVLPGWRAEDGTHIAGLRLDLEEGWKTYWRAPGEAGIPPSFDFEASENLAGFEVIFPTPIVFGQSGGHAIGYSGSVILPLVISPENGGDISLRGTLDIGVCKEVCLPVALELAATLPQDGPRRDTVIAGALAARPFSREEAGVRRATCTLTPTGDGALLTTTVQMPHTGGTETLVVEPGEMTTWVASTTSSRDGDTLTATSELLSMTGEAIGLNRSALRITVLGRDYAVEIQGCTGG